VKDNSYCTQHSCTIETKLLMQQSLGAAARDATLLDGWLKLFQRA
jgi:hypothetical protein